MTAQIRQGEYIGRDLVTRRERAHVFEPYHDYHDRRVYRSFLIAGAALAMTALAESLGLNTEPVRTAIEAVGAFTIPTGAGAMAGTGYYVARRDLAEPVLYRAMPCVMRRR
ncbi:MAG: hypothetical protein HY517_04145 [Candidatus Aenigmarchaeota archaeon]|nr:hypothetical protein [Candidatus Aenigmarchaeota archaeon]